MTTINTLLTAAARHLGDPSMEQVKLIDWMSFVNDAADDLTNMGWLLPLEVNESVILAANTYQYDIPTGFAYITEIRVGDKTRENGSTADTGINLDAAVSDTTGTALTVETMSPTDLFVVNDLIQIDDEVMRIDAIGSTTALTVTRGFAGTAAATHLDDADILRPFSDVTYEDLLYRAYWDIQTDTGGSGGQVGTGGSRAVLVINSDYFFYTGGTPLRFIGQKRPTNTYSAATDTVDLHVESFLRERALAYATRLASAIDPRRGPELAQLRREAMATSEKFEDMHPMEFRVKPSSKLVPGR